jgi:hypothetical protein
MIKNPEELQHIRESWRTVRMLQAKIDTTMSAHLFSLVPAMTNFRVVPESLLLLFAVSVLENTLEELRNQGVFVYKGRGLKGLMDASSKTDLPWQNFENIQKIKDRRDGVAHHHEILHNGECAEYLDAIAKELLAWGVLEPEFNKGEYGVSLQPTSE